jgi:di/tricarboxylate transporter
MVDQLIVFGTLILALVLFISGRWRYDVVALLALLTVVVGGVIPADQAFFGFGHPAVITVAAVLVVSRGLFNSGVIDLIARRLADVGDRPGFQVAALTALVAILSSFMNNIGALALLMPVAIRMARKSNHSPSLLLMPLAFGSLLGGLTTLIGTPPNIIVATFRARNGLEPFRMFDFTPVGLGVAVAGILFITLIGWRLVPHRKGRASPEELFQIENYMTEVRVTEESQLAGQPLRRISEAADVEAIVVALLRGDERVPAPSSFEILQPGDVLLVEADSESLKTLTSTLRLELVGSQQLGEKALQSDEVGILEAVVRPDSPMVGETVRSLDLRWRYGVNLLAVARHGSRVQARLSRLRFRPGDVVLLQGPTGTLPETAAALGALPLAERRLSLGRPRRLFLALAVFGAALLAAATGLLPVQVAFVAAAVVMVLTGLLSLPDAYDSIDWPIIILLGAMIPVGQALEVSGGADMIARQVVALSEQVSPVMTLGLVLVGTMFLSDLVNNAAAAVLMAPISVHIAEGIGASPDPFLMCVAIGASCAFLTPIGHQSNTLVMGPGGYEFGDYWRMGLLLEIIIVATALPLVLWFWPLH